MDILMECLRRGVTPRHTVDFAREYLRGQGFEELYYDGLFHPRQEGRYFIAPYEDVLFAFTVGQKRNYIQSVRMAFAHVDQPCFKIKSRPEFKNMECRQLNVEVYGGMMDHTWFDRPLGMAGTVALRGDDSFHPVTAAFDSRRPVAIIPGLAIHMQRGANDGWKIDRQKELMPVVGLAETPWREGMLRNYLAGELSVDASEILSWDLTLYNMDEPQTVGLDGELLSSPRIDNLASVSALLEAIVEGERSSGMNLIGLFHHEEVGSLSLSGADSGLLIALLRQIFAALGCGEDMLRASMAKSYFLSVDGAHGAHPNYPDKCDPTSRAYLGQGPAIKESGVCKYASDYKTEAILRGLAEEYDIPLQTLNDRNTIRGGTTLGPMIGAHLNARGCDIGVPMWAMHSARETMAAGDYESLCRLVTAFFVG